MDCELWKSESSVRLKLQNYISEHKSHHEELHLNQFEYIIKCKQEPIGKTAQFNGVKWVVKALFLRFA